MARTMKQEKITLVFREDLFAQALAECEASQVTAAELIRRAIDLYLCMFPAPQTYMEEELVPDNPEPHGLGPSASAETQPAPPLLRKYPFFINTGLLGELDRCAFQVGRSSDELANQALVLYHAYLLQRREAAEEIEAEAQSEAEAQDQAPQDQDPEDQDPEDDEGAAGEPPEPPEEDEEDEEDAGEPEPEPDYDVTEPIPVEGSNLDEGDPASRA